MQNVVDGFKLYDDIRAGLKGDIELNEIFNSFLDTDCYPDPEGITLAIDFGYFLGTIYNVEPSKQKAGDPAQLNSVIWRELLLDESFTNSTVKRYLKYWYDQPSHTASCKEISDKYDVLELKNMIEEHVAHTNSERGKEILEHFGEYLSQFKKIVPHDYRRMMNTIVQMEEKGLSSEQAQIEAFYAITSQ